MNTTDFWALNERTRQISEGDGERQAELLVSELASLPEEDILSYQLIFHEQMDHAYNWDLWAAAYIINCGCSDDGFMDFRAWLIGQGQTVFKRALENPEVLIEFVELSTITQVEQLLYVARHAYERKTGNEIPRMPHDRSLVAGTKWPEDDDVLRLKYPNLYTKLGDCSRWFPDSE